MFPKPKLKKFCNSSNNQPQMDFIISIKSSFRPLYNERGSVALNWVQTVDFARNVVFNLNSELENNPNSYIAGCVWLQQDNEFSL